MRRRRATRRQPEDEGPVEAAAQRAGAAEVVGRPAAVRQAGGGVTGGGSGGWPRGFVSAPVSAASARAAARMDAVPEARSEWFLAQRGGVLALADALLPGMRVTRGR